MRVRAAGQRFSRCFLRTRRFMAKLWARRSRSLPMSFSFFLNDTATTEIYTLSLHDALPIFLVTVREHVQAAVGLDQDASIQERERSEEHTSELQSREDIVCRLLPEKKK